MVVKMLFQRMFCEKELLGDDRQKLAKFWKLYLKPRLWSNMLRCAKLKDYEGLKRLIKELLPGHYEGEEEDEPLEEIDEDLPPLGEGHTIPEVE
jgi:hypothetical protein